MQHVQAYFHCVITFDKSYSLCLIRTMRTTMQKTSTSFLGMLSVMVLLVMILFAIAPALELNHHDDCIEASCVSANCPCPAHGTIAMTISPEFLASFDSGVYLLLNEMPSTGISIHGAPFQPPRA